MLGRPGQFAGGQKNAAQYEPGPGVIGRQRDGLPGERQGLGKPLQSVQQPGEVAVRLDVARVQTDGLMKGVDLLLKLQPLFVREHGWSSPQSRLSLRER